MGRPRSKRATVRGLDGDSPALELLNGSSIDLDTDDFAAWCEVNNTFAVEYDLGTFLVIAEKRARGGRYFIARAYFRRRRANSYIGTLPSAKRLRAAAERFVDKLSPDSASVTEDLNNYVSELVRRETDPERAAAAEKLLSLIESLDQLPVVEASKDTKSTKGDKAGK